MKFTYLIIGFILSIKTYSQNIAQQRKDSLSRTRMVMDDHSVPTSYFFDSLFVISEKYLKQNLVLAKSMNYTLLVYNSKDSAVFYVQTGKSILLNGKILEDKKKYIVMERCERSSLKLLTEKVLKDKFGLNNANGAFMIHCD